MSQGNHVGAVLEPTPLTQQELGGLKCVDPRCLHTAEFLMSRCHPGAPMFARYNRLKGVLELGCSTCHRLVCAVAVAKPDVVDGAPPRQEAT